LKTAKGSGLGMSIVHALVVDRYRGKIEVKNTVSDDYRKGTMVEILLKKAENTS
jgi:signal transduction histidine kinase